MGMLSLRRRSLLKYLGIAAFGACGAPFGESALRVSNPRMRFLTHPHARAYGSSTRARFASTIFVANDYSYVKRVYVPDGRTVIGRLPHPEVNNVVAMERLFRQETELLEALFSKYPRFFPAIRNVNRAERSFEMDYLGPDMSVRLSAGERLTKAESDTIWRIRDCLCAEKINVLLTPGNLYRVEDRIVLSGLNLAERGSGVVSVSPSLLVALRAA